MTPPLLRAANLARQHPGPPAFALQAESLELEAGAITVVQGPNGAGKSTLLRILAGLDSGGARAQFIWQGNRIGRPRIGRHTAFLAQDPYLFRASVRKNVLYPIARLGLPAQNAEQSLQWAGLADYADCSVRMLSGGQRRRLALACIHAMQAPLIILDEPTAQLDADAADALGSLAAELAGDGRTVVLSTHDVRMADSLAGARTIRIADGKLVDREGRPKQ